MVIDLFQQIFRQAAGFLPEYQKIVRVIGDLCIASRSLGAGVVHMRAGMLLKKVLKVIINRQVHHMPIIQPGTLHIFIIQRKAQRANQMKLCTRSRAGTGDIARILWNFRIYQYNIHLCSSNSDAR